VEEFKKHFNNKKWDSSNNKLHRDREAETLKLLEENFVNEPKIDHYPYMKMISTEPCTVHSDCYTMTLTHCGISAIHNARLVKTQNNIQPINLYNTVECIINNLRNLCLIHKDMKGDNVCINKDGRISLIDFGSCRLYSAEFAERYYRKPDLNHLKNELYNYVGCTESEHLMLKALGCDPDRDPHLPLLASNNNKPRWGHHSLFKKNPWSILYIF